MSVVADTHSSGEGARLRRVAELRAGGAARVVELTDELVDRNWAVRRAAISALSDAEPEAMPLLGDVLRSSRESEAKIAGLVDALSATKHDIDPMLLKLADDDSVAVICDAVQILGRRESAEAVPKLKVLTRHVDDNVALSAIEALARIGGSQALESLLAIADGQNFFRTFPTIDLLGRSRDARALPTLLQLAADPLYATEAVRALGRLADPAAIPALLEQLSRAGGSLVCAIALALVAMHEASEQRFGTGVAIERAVLAASNVADIRRQLTLSLKRADASEQSAVGRVLSWIGEESTVPTLLNLLRGSSAVAQVAAESLRKLGALAEPALIDALLSAPSEERRQLVPVLSGRLAARDALVACLDDEDPVVRAASCDALARTSDASAAPAIFRVLGDVDARVGQAALAAIQSLGSNETRRLTLQAASSSEPRLRRAALRIIGYFGYVEGLDAISEAAQASDERLRDAAIGGLPFIDDPRALALILHSAGHESARTRAAAVRALGHTGGEPAVRAQLHDALHDSDAWVRYYACQALGRLADDSATDAIAGMLTDDSGQVRVAAVEALAHLHGAAAFDALKGVLASGDADLYRAALVALGLSKREEALPMLLSALSSDQPATRLVALSALAELGAAEALPAIARATRDADDGVRVAATGFLAARSDPAAAEELIALLAEDPERQSLIRALAGPGAGRSEAIASALNSADDALAGALVASLARMHTEASLSALRAALTAANDAARRAAASALSAMQDPPSAAVLAHAALHDPDAEVRRICASFLR